MLVGLVLACSESAREETEEAASAAAEDVELASEAFLAEAQRALDELSGQIDDLDMRRADAERASTDWEEARREIDVAQQELESDLSRLRDATGQEAEALRVEAADALSTLTQRVERARLLAAETKQEFVSASQARLDEIDRDLRALRDEAAQLSADARQEALDGVESLRTEMEDLHDRVGALSETAREETAEERESVAEAIASLSASVRREWFELRGELSGRAP